MKVYVKGSKPVTLKNSEFKAQGGEGMIYCRGDIAYKIYHDQAKVIPADKFAELEAIRLDNVLAPLDLLYDYNSNTPVGFTMRYIHDTEYFCKLFTRSFRDKNNITPRMIQELVTDMQKTLIEIHNKEALVVDLNEMNFLTDKQFSKVFFIDVDSYQTRTYRATAIMDSIRDRLAPANGFNELTDWFSFAVVTFQLYMGCHPFKGRHHAYSMKETAGLKMMDDNVSVFHAGVRLPAGSQDWSVIPRAHYDWYKNVFLHNERSVPPFAVSGVPVTVISPVIIVADARFVLKELVEYEDRVHSVKYLNGVRYVVAGKKIFSGKNAVYAMTENNAEMDFCVEEGEVIVSHYDLERKTVDFLTTDDKIITTTTCDSVMEYNDMFYTVVNDMLLESSFIKMNKVIQQSKAVCDIFGPAFQLFKGVVVQNILGKCWLAIPYKPGACAQVHVKELDGFRVLDAAFASGNKTNVCILVGEADGKYKRFVLCFNAECSSYTVRSEETGVDTVNMVVLANGLCVTVVSDYKLEAFFDNTTVKVIDDPPVNSAMQLYKDGNRLLFADGKKIYHLSLGV